MKSLNKVQLIGNLGKDPEIKYLPNGTAVATFSIATGDSWKDKDGNIQEKIEWHNIVAWRKLAEIINQYLKKGSKVYIEGKLTHRSYDDNNGVKRYVTEVVADSLLMLGGMPKENAETVSDGSEPETDDLPF